MTTTVVDPVLQPITLANAPVRENAEDFGGAVPRDAEDDFKVAVDKSKDASTLPIVKPEEDKKNAGTQEEQTSLSVSDDSTIPKVTPAINDTVLAVEIPTDLVGMDKKASSIPVTVALTSDMISSSVPAVEHLEDTLVKNDNELASVIDSPKEEIQSLPASVTPQPTKGGSIPAPVLNPTSEDQVKFVAPEQLDFSSRHSDVKTDVVAIDDVAPDVLEAISFADKATISDNAPIAAGGVPLVEDTTVTEQSQAARGEATLGEESLGKEEYAEVTVPMAQKEPALKDIPVLDSAQSSQEPHAIVVTSIAEKDAVIEDAIVNEKVLLVEEEKRVAAAEGAVIVEPTPVTITTESFEPPSAPFLEAPIPDGITVKQLVSGEAKGTMIESVRTGEQEEEEDLATTITTKTIPLEDVTQIVSVVEAATVGERKVATFEAQEDEKIPVVEAHPILEAKELQQGGALPSERHESSSRLAEEASIMEAAASTEAGHAEAAIGGGTTPAVTVPWVQEPTSGEDTSTESAEQVMVEGPSTVTILTTSVVSEETLLGDVPSLESPAVEEKVVVSDTSDVKDAPITADDLDPAALTSITEDLLTAPSVDNAPSAIEAPVDDKSMVAEETPASEVASISTGNTLAIEEATGEPTAAGNPEAEILVGTTSRVVDENPTNHPPVALSVPTQELETAEGEIPVEKELLVDDLLIVEDITTTEELSAVEQAVQVLNLSENPPAIEEDLEEDSVIRPSLTTEDVTVGDKASSVVVGGLSVAELSLNENVIVKPGERVLEPRTSHTSTSSDPVVEEAVTLVAESADVAEKIVAVVTSPVEDVSLDDMPTAEDAVPLVGKANAAPTVADDLPVEQEGSVGGDLVAADPIEKVGVIDEETVLKVVPSPVEVPLDADTEKTLTKEGSIKGTAATTAEESPIAAVPQGESTDVVSDEKRISADEPSIVVETTEADEVHAAPSSGTAMSVDEEPGIERKGAEEEANTRLDDYVPSSQKTSSTEDIVASLVEEKPEEGETLARVDQSVIEDNNIDDVSLVDTVEINDSTPITVIEAPVFVDKVNLYETEPASTSTPSLDEVTVNSVSNHHLPEKESHIDAAETASTAQVDAGSHSAILLTPGGAEIEHPKSPWTPSYSVTTQGPGVPAEEDIPAIEDLPSSLSQVPVVALTPVNSSAPLDEVQTQISSENFDNRTKSPWTPSYSVSVQGSPLHGTVALDETEQVKHDIVADVSVAEEPASSHSNISDEVEATTEPVKDASQDEEPLVQPHSTLNTDEYPESTGEAISAFVSGRVVEKNKTTDDVKLPIEEEDIPEKELTTDTGIDRPASPQATSYSVTEGIVSMASEVVPENVIYEGSSQIEESYASQASIHDVADHPEVTIISQPVVVAEDAGTSEPTPPGSVRVEVRDLHAVERPAELNDKFEKPVGVKVDAELLVEQTVISSEESHSPVVQEPATSLAHEYVVDHTLEAVEPSLPSTTLSEVQFIKFDVGEEVVPRKTEVSTETLPPLDESPKDSTVTVGAQLDNNSITQEVILTPEPVFETEAKLRVEVSSSEELLAPAAEIERPASPWTPSYSVIQQGHATPTSEVETVLPTFEAAIDAPASKEHIVQTEPTSEDLSTNVEPSIEPPQVLAVVPDVLSGGEAKEDLEDVQPSAAAGVEISLESDTTLSANTEIDRPSSPWTPSYSVTQQGSASPVPESDVDVESAKNEVPAKDRLDEDIASLVTEPPRQVEPAEILVIAHTPVVVAGDEQIKQEPELSVGGEIASSVLVHDHIVDTTQEPLRQTDPSLIIPAVEEVPTVAAVPLAGPELHAVIASKPEPEVEPAVKEEPAEGVLDVHAVPTVPEPGNDLEPVVGDDTANVEKHQGVTLSPSKDVGPAVNGEQAEEGYTEQTILAAPELETDVESSVKDETVVFEPSTKVEEKESKGGEDIVSRAPVLVDEIKSVVKDEPSEDADDEEASSPIPASIEKEKPTETGEIPSPAEFVREGEVALPSPKAQDDSKPASKDVPVEDKTDLHIEEAASPVSTPALEIVAPEAEAETESAVQEETFDDERDSHIVSPAPVSVAREEINEQVVPLAESSAKGETAGDEYQQAAIVHDSEQHIEAVEDKQLPDEPVVQDELIKEGQDNEIILASSESAVEDKLSGEQVAAPSPELEGEIASAVVSKAVVDDHVEPIAAPEAEPHPEPVVVTKVELVATPAPDPHHEIETVEKEVEEPAEIVLDEQATLPVPESESGVVKDEPVASPAPVEIKAESAIADDSALLQGSDIESKARDEQIELPVTKEVPGYEEDATLPPPKAEPESVAKAEEGQIEDVQEIEPAAEEIEVGHEVVEGNHEQEASTVHQPSAKDEPTHAEQVVVSVLETQGTELVVDAKEAEDGPVSPEPVAEDEDEPVEDGHDEKAVSQGELLSVRDEEITPSVPELDSPAKEEPLEDEQDISPAAQPTPVLKEEPALAEPEIEEEVEEPAAVKDEVATLPTPELATEIKSLDLPAPEPDASAKEEPLEDEQAISPVVEPTPVSKEEPALAEPELEEEVEEPAAVKEEVVILPAPELATEIKSLDLPAPEPDAPAKEEPLEDEQVISPAVEPTPVSKEEPALAEPELEEEVEEPAVVKEEVVILSAPELATEIKSLEEVTLPSSELDSAAVKEKSFEDEQAISPAPQPAPALEEQVDIESVPVLHQEIKVEEPAEDVEELASEPAVVEDEPVIPLAPESATEAKSPVVEVESAVKDGDRPAVSPVAELKDEPVILATPESLAEVEPDVEEQIVVPVPVTIPAPELVAEVESVVADKPDAEPYVEPEAKDVQVESKSVMKDETVEDKLEEQIVPKHEDVVEVHSEQASSPELVIEDEPQQEEKIEVELAKEETFEPAVEEEQVEAAASEEQPSHEQDLAEEASDGKREAEPAVKDGDVAADLVEENTIDSRELSVDTSSFADSTKSPWTPSHSITTQDVGSPDPEAKNDLPGQAFPVTEEDRKSVGSLDTVNESADVVPETLEVPFARKRLESTASARLLRGALHKVPEGRASLDMAQGEFTKLPSPVGDKGIAETLTTATGAAEQESGTTSSEDSDGSSDDSSEAEHKGRWCVVM